MLLCNDASIIESFPLEGMGFEEQQVCVGDERSRQCRDFSCIFKRPPLHDQVYILYFNTFL